MSIDKCLPRKNTTYFYKINGSRLNQITKNIPFKKLNTFKFIIAHSAHLMFREIIKYHYSMYRL